MSEELVNGEDENGICLTTEMIGPCLSHLQASNEGLSQAYTRLTMVDMGIENIDIISQYRFLRFINFSHNCIKDVTPLGSPLLRNIVALDLSRNKIQNPKIAQKPSLQILDLSENNISELQVDSFLHPFLTTLNLNGNKISRLVGLSDPSIPLRFLEIRANILTNCDGLNPNIEELDMSGNMITDLSGIIACSKLKRLILAHNPISDLSSLPSDGLPMLEEIDLSRNKILDMKQLPLLKRVKGLKNVWLKGNPFGIGLEDGYRVEVLSFIPWLEKLDGKRVTEEELQMAAERKEQREEEERQKEEEERLRKEEEERIRKEEEERKREEEELKRKEEAELEELRKKEEEERRLQEEEEEKEKQERETEEEMLNQNEETENSEEEETREDGEDEEDEEEENEYEDNEEEDS
eukprot:MONOS_15093.1-p1 / transcript=MONOS_15093.1 / gene=MONOS_15093 / organism=Monocercomonoides_exilis_PA203 / gene_product=axonemal leucine-rich repeat protein / transcript_product=axonemal leucine-rich repeat protein / location=Mono_scaffold01142:7270-8832(-) / protein_length=408 / sequence_SO=supercontig / SO=protein_coding / is_pseudo=false